MRRLAIALLGTCCLLDSGCLAGGSKSSTAWVARSHPLPGPVGPEVVHLATLWLEAPAGDPLIDHDVWEATDDQILPVDKKAALQDNGIRVGLVSGLLPAPLRERLASSRDCANARLLQTHAGQITQVQVSGALADCEVEILKQGQRTKARWQDAECSLAVLPTLTEDGRICLRFTPEIRHGRATLIPEPVLRSTWMYEREQPTNSFGDLSWEMILDAGDYAMVGGRFDAPRSLGNRFFIRLTEAPPRQQLLVIHAMRGSDASEIAHAASDDTVKGDSPPLALQAAWSTARGSAP